MNPILRYLKQKGLSQQQLARIAGTSSAQISLWANGHRKPSVDEAINLDKTTQGGIPVHAWAKSKRAA